MRYVVQSAVVAMLLGVGLSLVERPRSTLVRGERPIFDAATVDKGRYLAAIGSETCHTRPGGQSFAGGLEIYVSGGVLGDRVSVINYTNNTPDRATGIGEWSFAQFSRAMRGGASADGRHLYPALPYNAFVRITDEDLRSIYAYLMSVDPIKAVAIKNDLSFPFSVRRAIAVWNLLGSASGIYAPDPNRSAKWNRGAYLVEGLGHCGACHSPRGFLLVEDTARALAVGRHMGPVAEGRVRWWSSVNLTPARTGLRRGRSVTSRSSFGWDISPTRARRSAKRTGVLESTYTKSTAVNATWNRARVDS